MAVPHAPAADLPDESPPPDGVLEARARAWHLSGDPTTIWPGLDPRDLQPAADAMGAAAARILDGGAATLGAADGRDAYAIGIAALVSGMGPLLGHWLERGRLDASEAAARLLAAHLAHGRRRAERIARGTLPAVERLAAVGVAPTVIKGFHTSHDYFPEPGARPLADVDLLVAPDEISRAEGALRDAGFSGSDFVESPYKRDFYPADDDARIWSFELRHARDRWKVELHGGVHFGELTRYGVRLDAPASALRPWDALGVPLRVPAQPLLAAILSVHVAGELYVMRLLRLVELTLVVRRDRERGLLDWDALEELLRRSGATRFALPAFALAERLAPGTVDAGFLARVRAASPRRTRVVTDRFSPTAPLIQGHVSLAERLMLAQGPMQTVMRLAQLAVPHAGERSWSGLVRTYHRGILRLLTGRVSWRGERTAPPPPPERVSGD
ncbi:MAG TPA: nucleotidyltransferase family protein [Gemmatimonadaceae bacterium]|nr:nucleotidyltransferase family protein [Gemmatimonadaceae bacterium]